MAVVVFNPIAFKQRYPEFESVSDQLLKECFIEGTLYLSNEDNSIVQNVDQRAVLLNMLTAHIAFIGGALQCGSDGAPTPGRLSSATEGSVSISTEYNVDKNAAWFAQSAYGAAFWQATLKYRSFRYVPRPTRIT